MNVVVGYVPTPEGESALHHALEEARGRKARLLVVNTSRGDALVDERFADEGQMNLLRDRLTASGVDHEVIHGIHGRDASEEILSVARDRRADLIVVGLRRRSPVGKLILGSTGQRVLLEADCPVLAVKS
ncbi:MAG TPA: universal stress protein [Actinomycetales bacterium]|jgi:nucleotide-binding universal stress UspA family protein|nr:universal stress protein [Actinomycetales bacterium]